MTGEWQLYSISFHMAAITQSITCHPDEGGISVFNFREYLFWILLFIYNEFLFWARLFIFYLRYRPQFQFFNPDNPGFQAWPCYNVTNLLQGLLMIAPLGD
jgi:hypothetical protein